MAFVTEEERRCLLGEDYFIEEEDNNEEEEDGVLKNIRLLIHEIDVDEYENLISVLDGLGIDYEEL